MNYVVAHSRTKNPKDLEINKMSLILSYNNLKTVESMNPNIQAMKAVLIPSTVMGPTAASDKTEEALFDVKSEEGLNQDEGPTSQRLLDMWCFLPQYK